MSIPRLDAIDRNFLINGGFDYWQRALSSISAGSYPTFDYNGPDRWQNAVLGVGPTSYTLQRVVASPDSKTKYALQISVNNPNSTEEDYISQRIESIFAKDLAGSKASFSLQMQSPACRQVKVTLYTADVEDAFSAKTQFATQTFTALDDNTWQEFKFEDITVPPIATRGIEVEISFSDWSITGSVTTVNVAQVKLNKGTKAQGFSYSGRDLVEELQLCQRYFESLPQWTFNDATFTSQQPSDTVWFKVIKRDIPIFIITIVPEFNALGAGNYYTQDANTNSVDLIVQASAGTSQVVRARVSQFEIDAEL